MSSNLMLDFMNPSMMNKEAEDISIDQDGEWDISLFDDLDGLGDADELLQALVESVSYDNPATDLNFDIGDPGWTPNGWRENASPPSDGDVTANSLSPNHTLSSVSSPASVEPCSPYSSTLDEVHSPLSWNSQPSPLSVCSDSSGFSEIPVEKKPPKRTNQTLKAKPLQAAKRPIQTSTKVSIQPKPLITALPITHAAASLQAKTIIIQPLQTTILQKPSPVTIQPAPSAGRPMLLTQPAQVVQLQTQAVTTRVVTVPTLAQDRPATASQVVAMTLSNSTPEDDSSGCRRQQRMIKNRESAAISRKKKKEYLLTLEARLNMALSENEKLKNENGTLKRQLEGLMSENSVLNATAPKRRAVCLMVVLVFLVVNLGPISLLGGNQESTFPAAPSTGGRHLLGFSVESERNVESNMPETDPSNVVNRLEDVGSEQKALMVVKREPLYFRDPPSCQPPVNRTKCMKIANELRGWVHRHEVERTKTRRMSNTHLRGRTMPKVVDKPVSQIVTEIQYRDSSEKNPSSELQVYYAPHRTYNDFFDELNRRGDTFYVISFRRDHLLLPATSHNKGSRPKMSLVLPAMNYNSNDSVLKDKEFEVMMQIDCEVMDTRILHIKSSSIPPILRVNQTDSIYHPAPSNSQPATPVGVLMGSS
ncbi:cyclic AMP-dependent transcription factor ATF-6 alpha [Triplophysa dalaica]|uniref:cyclic AMP-dependent transcription factor ATF-6 alpha n=1 Tax=Triplophysa dalaica TaxID=1582913 RepID=UPI0024E0221A|nr:cyclic AMP-dependent transcription factor ATF-6 alpha [Triplophysa dalaica]